MNSLKINSPKKMLPISKYAAIGLYILAFFSGVPSQEKSSFTPGFLIMGGGRYDNLRMCVATDSGVKGGPIADIMFTGRFPSSDKIDIGFNIPVMRPILFAAAFKMLQFEPEMVFDFHKKVVSGLRFSTAPSIGVSLHYGPDYHSDRKNRSPSFFAAGPIIGIHLSMGKTDENGLMKNSFGVKPFYSSLFAKGYPVGTVIGGALEYQRQF